MKNFSDQIEYDNTASEDEIAKLVQLAELAYAQMYESTHPKDERDDALHHLNRALRIARNLKLKEKEAELSERYAHIEAVFNAQFRYL